MTTPHSKLEVIRALLAKAERTDIEAERDAYNAKAMQLMAKYGIEQAMVETKRPTREMPTTRTWKVTAPYVTDRRLLLACIGEALGLPNYGVRFWDRETGKYGWYVTLTGFASDLERADVLWTSLLVQMASGLASAHVPWNEEPKAYRKSWMFAFAVMVGKRLRDAELRAAGDAEREAPGTDLVLVDRRQQVKAAFDAEHGNVRTLRRAAPSSEAGRRDGYAAGARANLGRPGINADSGARKLGH